MSTTTSYTYVQKTTCTTCTQAQKYDNDVTADKSWVSLSTTFTDIAVAFPKGLSFSGDYGTAEV